MCVFGVTDNALLKLANYAKCNWVDTLDTVHTAAHIISEQLKNTPYAMESGTTTTTTKLHT